MKKRGLYFEFGRLCQTLFSGFHRSLDALASAGNNFIVDDVLMEPLWLREAVEALAAYEVCFVGVRRPIDIAEMRERTRSDRAEGAARGQYHLDHANSIYDVEVDTSILTPEECAERISETQRRSPHPSAFERLRSNSNGIQ